jgi:hypothetical protein
MAAVRGRVRTTVYAVLHRLLADECLRFSRQRPSRKLSSHLVRDEHLIDEGSGPRLEVGVPLGASGGLGAHVSPWGCQDGDAHQAI